MSIITTYPFTTPANYLYDAGLIEVAGGYGQLKSQVPIDATFGANYNSDIDGNWGEGVLIGIPVGGVAVSGGKLDLSHNDIRYVDYDANLNADSQQVGAVRFLITPNYNGTPPDVMCILSVAKVNGNTTNAIILFHNTGMGHLGLTCWDEINNIKINIDLGVWNPSIGVEYEFELNYDFTTGATRVFVDGTQFGVTQTAVFIRSSLIGLLRIGSNVSGVTKSNFKIDDFIVFDSVQHTADYIPGYTVPEKYSMTNPTINPAGALSVDGLFAYIETVIKAGLDDIKTVIEKAGVNYWWNGLAWVMSSGYAESNTAAEINVNMASWDLSNGFLIRPILYLHSENGSTTPQADSITIEYDDHGAHPGTPNECNVWGYIYDIEGNPVEGVSIRAKIKSDMFSIYNADLEMMPSEVITLSRSDGYWELSLVETASINPVVQYEFTFTDKKSIVKQLKSIPDEASKNYSEL